MNRSKVNDLQHRIDSLQRDIADKCSTRFARKGVFIITDYRGDNEKEQDCALKIIMRLQDVIDELEKLVDVGEPTIEDVYQHEAEHSGFKSGEVVLLEGMIVNSYDRVSTVAVHTSPGVVIMVSNKLIYHKD